MASRSLLIFGCFLDSALGHRLDAKVVYQEPEQGWTQCATKGVGCGVPYRGVSCSPGIASDLSAEYTSNVASSLSDYVKALTFSGQSYGFAEIVNKVLMLAENARSSLSLARKLKFQDINTISMAETLRKLEQSITIEKDRLAVLEKDTSEERRRAYTSYRNAKKEVFDRLAAKYEPLLESNIISQRHDVVTQYLKTDLSHEQLQEVEKSALADLHEFLRKLVLAQDKLSIAGKIPDKSKRKAEVSKAISTNLRLLRGQSKRFAKDKSGFIQNFQDYKAKWDHFHGLAETDFKDQIHMFHKIAEPFGRAPLGPFRLFEVDPHIVQDFLDNQLPQVFLGLSSCHSCDKNAVADLQLNFLVNGEAERPYTCVQAKSGCLQSKAVCGCYALPKQLSRTPSVPALVTHEFAPAQFANGGHTQMGCTDMIYQQSPYSATDIGSSTLEPQTSCSQRQRDATAMNTSSDGSSLRICMVTWNIGSERHVAGYGVGWGGIDDKHGELKAGLTRVFAACPSDDYDFVVVTTQEGSDDRIVPDISAIARNTYGPEWAVVHSFARGNENVKRKESYKGFAGNKRLHELPSTKRAEFAEGVHIVMLARKHIGGKAVVKSYRSFAVEFSSGSLAGNTQKFIAGSLGSTGHKGAAVIQVRMQFDGRLRNFCFAGSHLDASSEHKRSAQADIVTKALETIGCPDGAWWAGDFNPRLQADQCCPWDRLELLMHHGQREAVGDLVRDMDPISRGTSWLKISKANSKTAPFVMPDWKCVGRQCSAGWHELPIGFAPTFHKLYHREGRSSSEGTCHFSSVKFPKVALSDEAGAPMTSPALGTLLQHLNVANSAHISSWSPEKRFSGETNFTTECPASGRHMICWDGEYNDFGCKRKGYCYHTHEASHCPLLTDRILFAASITSDGPSFEEYAPESRAGMYPTVVGCRYEALPQVTSSDHSPVVGSFMVTFGR